VQNYSFFVNPTIANLTKKCTIFKHVREKNCKMDFTKRIIFKIFAKERAFPSEQTAAKLLKVERQK